MDKLSPRDQELVAIGASLASNCIPCVAYHIAMARKAGLSEYQVSEAIEVADRVRQMPARAVLDAALRASPEEDVAAECGCGGTTGAVVS